MFSESAWTLIAIVCIASPLIGILIKFGIQRRPLRRSWKWIAIYYAAVIAAFGIMSILRPEIPIIAVACLLVVLAGPFVAIVLLL
jgi:energy-converting hydrogenase Eha subunit A